MCMQIFSSNPIIQTTKLLVRQSYYDENVWEGVLKEMLGERLTLFRLIGLARCCPAPHSTASHQQTSHLP